jgi:hypothetical protein
MDLARPRFRSLGIVSLAIATGAFETVACSGGSDHPSTDGGDLEASRDAGRRDAFAHDASVDAHIKHPVDAISDAGDCALGPSGEALELRCAGLYSDWASKTVSADLTAFVPGLQFWSDGAQKTRWIYLPPGQQIDTSNMDEWTFPVGTKFWKEFRVPVGSSTTLTRIETRLIWKSAPSAWYRTTYRWSPDGETSASELITGELDANGGGYEIPDQSQCTTCHGGRLDGVLGFEAVGLSSPGASPLTLAKLASAGTLTNPPSAPPTVPGDAVESAALGWLHMNCGAPCHNRGTGKAADTHFFMRLDVATLATVETTDTYTTGWNVPTMTGFEITDASATYRFHACDIGESAGYYRPSHRDGNPGTPASTQMPPIDTHKVDEAGVAKIAAWINEGCPADGGITDGATKD